VTILELHAEEARLRTGLLARNTVVGYAYDWAMFAAWCAERGRGLLPATPETVSLYLTDLLAAGKKITTARRRCCAIAHEHRAGDYPSPIGADVRGLLRGAQRLRGEKPRQMRPLSVQDVRDISAVLRQDNTPVSLRNRALIVLGFATALRRSSLAELERDDVEFVPQGLVVHVRREKQDQEGRGRYVGVPRGQHADTCSVRCLEAWLDVRGCAPGPLFPRLDWRHRGQPLDGECIWRVIKTCVKRIGLDPAAFGAHSLRAGFVTAAGESGASLLVIAAQTGHRSLSVLQRYFRRTELFRSKACTSLGL
jgi:site-specific recombinase XerD